jgi:hypothetical protein
MVNAMPDPTLRGRPGQSHDQCHPGRRAARFICVLRESGDLGQFDDEAISEEEKIVDADMPTMRYLAIACLSL